MDFTFAGLNAGSWSTIACSNSAFSAFEYSLRILGNSARLERSSDYGLPLFHACILGGSGYAYKEESRPLNKTPESIDMLDKAGIRTELLSQQRHLSCGRCAEGEQDDLSAGGQLRSGQSCLHLTDQPGQRRADGARQAVLDFN